MDEIIEKLVAKYLSIWWELAIDLPAFDRHYSPRKQAFHESQLDNFLNILTSAFKQTPQTKFERHAVQEHIFSAFAGFAKSALGFKDQYLNVLHDFIEVASEFAEEARRFDPEISGADARSFCL